VLVVDDNPDICSLLDAFLTDEGYGCITCPLIVEALVLLHHQPVALILTAAFGWSQADVLGPTAPLRQACAGTPLLPTGYPVDEAAARATGIAAVVPKPFEVDVLLRGRIPPHPHHDGMQRHAA
jgi:CheY-like chemotaxis protein